MVNEEVAVIGLGGMGTAMAHRLLDRGQKLAVWNRTAAAAAPLAARGARLAASPADAARTGGIAISMVADDAALVQVTEGPAGLLDSLGAGGVHVSMSTVSPALVARLAAAHEAAGGRLVGAPVFGRPAALRDGKAWVALAGDQAGAARVRPVLASVGQAIHEFGPDPAAASTAKLAGNFMIAAAIEAMGEAFVFLQKQGVDARAFHAMVGSSIFACPIYANYGRFILDGAFDPPGFRLALGLKDVGLFQDAALKAEASLPLASMLRDRFTAALAKGRGALDWTSLALQAAEDSGLADTKGAAS